MKPNSTLELATGFVMGSVAGIVIEFAFITFYNVFCAWQGCTMIMTSWWMMIPFPLVSGYLMAIAIAGLHLEDY